VWSSWAETQNARGLTPNRVANSNEMPGNNSCAPAYSGVCDLPLANRLAGDAITG